MAAKNIKLAEIQKKIDRGEIKIQYASSDRVSALRQWVDRVLSALGHPEAFVSNLSTVGDFWPRGERDELARRLTGELGVQVSPGDYVVDVASRLRLKSMH